MRIVGRSFPLRPLQPLLCHSFAPNFNCFLPSCLKAVVLFRLHSNQTTASRRINEQHSSINRKYEPYTRSELQEANSYCLEYVRKSDYESYLALLFLPERIRPAAAALRAFNSEIARVREVTKEPEIAALRFAWWRDSLQEVYQNKPRKHPVVLSLAHAYTSLGLSSHYLEWVVEAREQDYNRSCPADVEEIENYAEATASALLYLMLEAVGVNDIPTRHCASHIGKALGVATLLRGTPFHLGSRHCYLPSSILMKHDVTEEQLYRHRVPPQKIADLVYEMACVAMDHLRTAKEMMKDMQDQNGPFPKPTFACFLPVVSCERFLVRLEKRNFNIFSPDLVSHLPFHGLVLVWRYLNYTLIKC